MDEWGNRELRTSKLVRLCTEYLLNNKIDGTSIYGLCMLTWITKSNDPSNGTYIRSTKLPALSYIFKLDFLEMPYEEVGEEIAELTGKKLREIEELIYNGTGYTNFYNAFRNSSKSWIEKYTDKIEPLIKKGYNLKSDREAESIILEIAQLPEIPKGNNAKGKMAPESLLTPLFFSLDKRLRFPLINRKEGVTKLLKQLGVNNLRLIDQFRAITDVIGKGDIQTSIDFDRLGGELPYFVRIDGEKPKRKKLKQKSEKELGLKDEEDLIVLKKALTTKARRLHNHMTNLLINKLMEYDLHEGNAKENMFDVLVKNINDKHSDLLIEVKSSSKTADVRMAVGQLMDYSRQLDNYDNTYLAVFLPEKPIQHVIDFLKYHDFNLLWIEEEEIYCNCKGFPFKYKEI